MANLTGYCQTIMAFPGYCETQYHLERRIKPSTWESRFFFLKSGTAKVETMENRGL